MVGEQHRDQAQQKEHNSRRVGEQDKDQAQQQKEHNSRRVGVQDRDQAGMNLRGVGSGGRMDATGLRSTPCARQLIPVQGLRSKDFTNLGARCVLNASLQARG